MLIVLQPLGLPDLTGYKYLQTKNYFLVEERKEKKEEKNEEYSDSKVDAHACIHAHTTSSK